MGYLTAQQTAAVKQARSRAWNQPFSLLTYAPSVPAEPFGPMTEAAPVTTALLGDWRWNEQMERHGRPGGGWTRGAELTLACDIVHAPLFMQAGVRLMVPDQNGTPKLLEVLTTTEYPGSGECVVTASLISREA